ncbi:MAG: L,D-transpeptidase family protein [Solirubrobacterales bacterium]
MGRKLQIGFVFVVAICLLLAGGAYAWDSVTKDTIAEGVTVGGVDVGGMDELQARKVLRDEVVEPYSRSLTVTHGDQEFTLTAGQLEVRSDLDGMIDEALAVSQEGGITNRVWRLVSGDELDKDVDPRVGYAQEPVDEFVANISEEVRREPRNASVEPSSTQIEPVSSQNGVKLREKAMLRFIDKELQLTGSEDKVEAPVEEIEPEVTSEALAVQYPHFLTVDRGGFKLRHYENLELARTYDVAIGAIGFETPTGQYHITNKQVDPTWYVPDREWAGDLAGEIVPPGPDNPLKARWMGFHDGAGIHGTADEASIGSAASHGCVRMRVTEVKELYDVIPDGTPIYIG